MSNHMYKNFIYEMRKMECESPYIIVLEEHPTAYLKGYVKMVLEVPFDATAYNGYYIKLKNIVGSFINFYVTCLSHARKRVEAFAQYTLDEMMQLMENTINIHNVIQEEFLKEYQPIESTEEQNKLEAIITNNRIFEANLLELSQNLASFKIKRTKIEEFAKQNVDTSIEKTSLLCEYTHIFIAKLLADRVDNIRISIEETLYHIQRNRRELQTKYDERLNKLYDTMYDLNKESLHIMRRRNRQSKDIAEVRKLIEGVKGEIEKLDSNKMFKQLDLEENYWSGKLQEFCKIATNITKIKDALQKIKTEEITFSEHKVIELPGPKITHWKNMEININKRKVELEEKYTDTCRQLITFFCCKGSDRILKSDSFGSYWYVDDYGHQNYAKDYGAKVYHVNCDGSFIENSETDKYYYDVHGRYILEDGGEKIYQLAPCTSHYKMGEDRLMYKITQDCGHSTKPNEKCQLELRDRTSKVLLPKTEQVNIKGTMNGDTVEYLWNAIGWILPEVLCKLGNLQSNNPIHQFGHTLLEKRYGKTEVEIKARMKEAQKYRQDSMDQRQIACEAEFRIWKSKMSKRCKPEDLDTKAQDVAYAVQKKEQQYITDMTLLCYDD